jgi:DNA-directed RNA polymerase specialized sigma24 family protein
MRIPRISAHGASAGTVAAALRDHRRHRSARILVAAHRAVPAMRELIATLPPKLADAVLLRYFEELSEKEVAEALGVPVGTIKSRLHNATSKLRLVLERSQS